MKKYILLTSLSFFFTITFLSTGVFVFYPEHASAKKESIVSFTNNITDTTFDTLSHSYTQSIDHLSAGYNAIAGQLTSLSDSVTDAKNDTIATVSNGIDAVFDGAASLYNSGYNGVEKISLVFTDYKSSIIEATDKLALMIKMPEFHKQASPAISANYQPTEDNIKVASLDGADSFALLEPMAGNPDITEDAPEILFEYDPQENEIETDVVLVPREKTIISSSRDGKIKSINFANGDIFNKGDILLEYECKDINAEIEAAKSEQKLAGKKMLTTSRLYDLDIASRIDKEQAETEKKLAQIKQNLTEIKMDSCVIRAQFNGRVIKRLANANEYTRTDRVLMEIASSGTLDAEFLMPSIWLRWVNIDAPLTFVINETGKEYTGKISNIYGEVDPVSQSIQIRASLDDYNDPLLPGMSGKTVLNVDLIRQAGIRGFLETTQ